MGLTGLDPIDELHSILFDLKHYTKGLKCLLVGGDQRGDTVLDISQQELCALFEYVDSSVERMDFISNSLQNKNDSICTENNKPFM